MDLDGKLLQNFYQGLNREQPISCSALTWLLILAPVFYADLTLNIYAKKRDERLADEALEIAEAVAGIEVVAIRPRRGTPLRPALFPHTAKKEASGMIDD